MQINSVNSPAFGCGACASVYKKVPLIIKNEPSNALSMAAANKKIKPFVQCIIRLRANADDLTHVQAASNYNKDLSKRLSRLI